MKILKFICSLFKREFPKHIRNVWYNNPVHTGEKYPMVFDKDKNYIDCKVGNLIAYQLDSKGNEVFYKIIRVWKERPYSDWLYPSDSIHCDLKFSHVEIKNERL